MKLRLRFGIKITLLSVFFSGFSKSVCAQDTVNIQVLLEKSMNFKSSNVDSMMYYGEEALRQSAKINWKPGISQSLTRVGLAYKYLGNTDSAYSCFIKSIAIRKEIGPPQKLAGSYLNLAVFFKDITAYDSSTVYFILAIEQAKLGGDVVQIADIKMSWASLMRRLKNYETATKLYTESEATYQERKDFNSLADLNFNFGNLYDESGDVINAKKRYEKGLFLYNQINNLNGVSKCYNGLGVVEFRLYNFNSGRIYFEKSIEIKEQLKNSEGIASALINWGSLEINAGNFSMADSVLNKAIVYGSKANDNLAIKNAYENLIQVYLSQGRKNDLLRALKLKDSLQNIILDESKQREILKIEEGYHTKELISANKALEAETRSKELKAQKFQIIIILLIFLVVVICVFYYQNSKLNKKRNELANKKIDDLLNTQEINSLNAMMEGQQVERKRIAQDLHDTIGSMLSAVKLHFSSLEDVINKNQHQDMLHFDKLNHLLDDAVGEVRRISYDLTSGILTKFGLTHALNDLCENIESAGHFKIQFISHGLIERLPPNIEIGIYRIIQELLSNVMKHANASEVTVQLTKHDSEVTIIVEDNGKGYDITKPNNGMGLKNIAMRADKLNGIFVVDSVLGKGVTSILTLKNLDYENNL